MRNLVTLQRVAMSVAFVLGACAVFMLLRGAISAGVTIILCVGLAVLLYRFHAPIRIWISAKLHEWSSDWKQLKLWVSLAFTPKRDAQATATMAHQQAFLAGRIMSPMNLFAIAAVLVVSSIGAVGIEEWRIGRIKKERDAPCSVRELSLNEAGRFRTTRASCATLGGTLAVAVQWQERAAQIQAAREGDAAQAQRERDAQIEAQRATRRMTEQSLARQRRRQNEAITAALGGPPPDLERSVCELAGGDACATAATDGAGAPAVASDLPAGP